MNMIGRSFEQTTIALATLAGIAAIIFLWFIPATDQNHTISVVTIEFADARGAGDWTLQEQKAFLQDPTNRWLIDAKDLGVRGELGPQQWLPPSDQCRYISRFVEVMERYDLDRNQGEMKRLHSQRQQCYTQFQ
jgi:hypothetical protein